MAKQNKAQLAYERIREKLISRSLEPKERLVERVWAERLNVNRADVRQALSRLLGEGLLEAGPKGGFFVRDFSTADMNEFNEIRLVLESAAAKFTIKRATKKDISELEQICEHMRMMAENGYIMGFGEADLKFHETLVKAAHNKKMESIYKGANLPLSLLVSREISKKEMLKDAEVHAGIVEALKKKDLSAMIKLISKGIT